MSQISDGTDRPDRPGVLVEVEWIDITGQAGWHDIEQARKQRDLGRCFSVGHLVEDDERGVLLVTSWGDFGLVGDSMSIPRHAIVEVRRLQPSGGRRGTRDVA